MHTAYFYLALSGILTLLLWTPYILARVFVWGIPSFLNNYPEKFPQEQPIPPLWASRAQRAHLNMVETMPAFIAVIVAAGFIAPQVEYSAIAYWSQIFFFARVVHAIIYIAGIPFLRTPVYLVSWAAILVIGAKTLL